METIQLDMSIDLIVPEDQRQPVRDWIDRYRRACEHMFAVLLLAQRAGATIVEDGERGVRVVPNGKAAKAILEKALGKVGKALAYELRDYFLQELCPGALSFVWDSARRDVEAAWRAPDPQFPKARRGFLCLQGAREGTRFARRAIGFPVATARPQLHGHELTLKWDHNIGPVTFGLGRLDPGRFWIWRNLRDHTEGWDLGTIYLGKRDDGQVRAKFPYTRPARLAAVDPSRVLTVRFGEPDSDAWITLSGPDGEQTYDTISGVEVVAWLRQMYSRRKALEARRGACGSPRQPWGDRRTWLAAQQVLSRLTLHRENGVHHRNQCWTRRIIERSVAWRCGTIVVGDVPSETLAGLPWNWTDWKFCLAYKGKDRGITVSWVSSAPDAAPAGR